MYRQFRLILTLLMLVCGIGCSSSDSNPVVPVDGNLSLDGLLTFQAENSASDRELFGKWTLRFDPETIQISITENRQADAHFSVRPYLPPVAFTVNSYDSLTGILDVDAIIENSFGLDGFDLRMIVFTDNLGCRLVNSDNWTSLFDIPGGASINPFKAYAKDEENRIFEGGASHSERLQLYFPAGFDTLDFAIDVSYPNNCAEPYEIVNFSQSPLHYLTGSEAVLNVEILDWQSDTSAVNLWCPAITGSSLVPFTKIDGINWAMSLENATGASVGNYQAVIVASSGGLSLYDVVQITVSDSQAEEGYQWSFGWGGNDDDSGRCIALDSSGNVYVAGNFRETVDFDPSEGIDEQTSMNDWDIFLSKYNSDGTYIWTKTWGGPQIDNVGAIAIDDNDNIFVTGFFSVEIDLDPGPGIDYYHCVGNYAHDAFLSKFDTDGNYIWGRKWGGEKNEFTYGLTVDMYGNPMVTGSFWITADFDPSDNVVNHTSNGRTDAFLLILDENGNYVISYTWGGSGEDRCNDVCVDPIDDDFFLVGDFENTVDLDPTAGTSSRISNGSSDCYLIKFDTNGLFVDAKAFGGPDSDIGKCIEIDSSGNVHIAGSFGNSVDFDPDGSGAIAVSYGASDAFLLVLDNDLSFGDIYTWGGLYDDRIYGMDIDINNFCYIAGSFGGTVDFNPLPGENLITSCGLEDAFTFRIDPSGDFEHVYIFGGVSSDRAYAVVSDGYGTFYTTGSFEGFADFNPGFNVDELISNGSDDAFLVKIFD